MRTRCVTSYYLINIWLNHQMTGSIMKHPRTNPIMLINLLERSSFFRNFIRVNIAKNTANNPVKIHLSNSKSSVTHNCLINPEWIASMIGIQITL